MIELYYTLIYVFTFIFGSILGSFLNVLILRIHNDEQWWYGRSYCPKCKKELTWKELIPILSFIFLKGKCSNCGKRILLQYPLVEFVSSLLAVFCLWRFGISFEGLIIFFVSWLLLGSFVSDLKYMELPEIFSWTTVVFGVLYQIFVIKLDIWNVLTAVVFGFLFFWLQYFLTKGKGLGEGDIRLGVIMGLFLGWPLVLYSIMSAYIFATVTLLPLILMKKLGRKSMIPLGAFLIPVFLVFLYYSNELQSIFKSIFLINL